METLCWHMLGDWGHRLGVDHTILLQCPSGSNHPSPPPLLPLGYLTGLTAGPTASSSILALPECCADVRRLFCLCKLITSQESDDIVL